MVKCSIVIVDSFTVDCVIIYLNISALIQIILYYSIPKSTVIAHCSHFFILSHNLTQKVVCFLKNLTKPFIPEYNAKFSYFSPICVSVILAKILQSFFWSHTISWKWIHSNVFFKSQKINVFLAYIVYICIYFYMHTHGHTLSMIKVRIKSC